MEGSEHVPNFRRNSDPPLDNLFANMAIDWLLAHRKPGINPCPGDVDIDGEVDIDDLLPLLGDWGGTDTASDINLDGTVNVLDLLALISAWGPCP